VVWYAVPVLIPLRLAAQSQMLARLAEFGGAASAVTVDAIDFSAVGSDHNAVAQFGANPAFDARDRLYNYLQLSNIVDKYFYS
jgi:hypothetical protein